LAPVNASIFPNICRPVGKSFVLWSASFEDSDAPSTALQPMGTVREPNDVAATAKMRAMNAVRLEAKGIVGRQLMMNTNPHGHAAAAESLVCEVEGREVRGRRSRSADTA
jgi:hypothetical protein